MELNAVSPRISYCAEASLILAVIAPATIYYSQVYPDTLEVAIIGFLVGCPLALILGLVGRSRGGEAKRVANLAIGLAVLTVFFSCTMSANRGGHHPYRRAQFMNNMKQVGLALHNYKDAYGRFPPAVVRDANGRPLYSWRVLILPFMEQSELYNQFHLDEAWDSRHNRALLSRCPLEYRPIGVDVPEGGTFIQVYVGPGTAFENPLGEPLALGAKSTGNFPDGTSETILAVEAGESVPWSAPFDLP